MFSFRFSIQLIKQNMITYIRRTNILCTNPIIMIKYYICYFGLHIKILYFYIRIILEITYKIND